MKVKYECDIWDNVNVEELAHDKIIIKLNDNTELELDRKTASLLFSKLDETLHDETYENLESKLLDAENEIDKLKDEAYWSNHVSELDDYDAVSNL